ncbi:MauE/DoxX family redox-associated membrane protein [Spirillospora sp. NBC_01491]|uniref:MauE/DoxX family redox-associated membrane protein n=1 Tax=Spirillospora sp. NBC_01491 TaxID=2976007 RepID=UPI002E3144A9|nr:MauE/DoxX family redox-associated membrane protein [Spirillospora sp. NBC_01491]
MADLIVFAVAVLLAEVFAVSAAGKIRGRTAFAGFAGSVPRLVPRLPARPAAVAVLAGELATPPLLLIAPAAGFALAALLLAAFGAAIGAALRTGRRAPCRCFGTSAAPLGPAHLVRAALLAALAAAGAAGVLLTGPTGTLFALLGGAEASGLAVAAAAGSALAVVAVFLDDLVFLFGDPGRI